VLVSASTRTEETPDLPPPEFPGNPEAQPDSMCTRQQLKTVLSDAMKALPERCQEVVFLYYTEEMKMREMGDSRDQRKPRLSDSQIHPRLDGRHLTS
jgi:DNA-directed RNA polymerase specialized sigma24 family protein